MKHSILLAALLSLSTTAMSESIQTIRIDDDHLQLQRADGKASPKYSIHPASSVDLVATGYKFKIPAALEGKHPNSIQLVLGRDQAYSAKWVEGQDRYHLSKATLTPNPGSPPFNGFPAAASGIVAVGLLEDGKFSVIWVGMFNVQ